MANAILSTAIFVCIVALVAMVVAHALPYWTEFETGYLGGIKGHYGLWIGCMEYAVVQFNECAHDLTCKYGSLSINYFSFSSFDSFCRLPSITRR